VWIVSLPFAITICRFARARTTMPLIATNRPVTFVKGAPWAVGLWMQIESSNPDDLVWVIVTYECVEDLDHPGQLADQSNATAIVESNRTLLEKTASAKFDEKGVDPEEGKHDGKPILRLHSYDLPG
jgi:hypothetical protein